MLVHESTIVHLSCLEPSCKNTFRNKFSRQTHYSNLHQQRPKPCTTRLSYLGRRTLTTMWTTRQKTRQVSVSNYHTFRQSDFSENLLCTELYRQPCLNIETFWLVRLPLLPAVPPPSFGLSSIILLISLAPAFRASKACFPFFEFQTQLCSFPKCHRLRRWATCPNNYFQLFHSPNA